MASHCIFLPGSKSCRRMVRNEVLHVQGSRHSTRANTVLRSIKRSHRCYAAVDMPPRQQTAGPGSRDHETDVVVIGSGDSPLLVALPRDKPDSMGLDISYSVSDRSWMFSIAYHGPENVLTEMGQTFEKHLRSLVRTLFRQKSCPSASKAS
jgi:hypothetical protein